MQAKDISTGPEGRRIISQEGQPRRVALPMQCIQEACTDAEKAILWRFFEAFQLSQGNYAVAVIDGQPRGRYEQYAKKVDFETYRDAEVGAFRWIMMNAFGKEARGICAILCRLDGEQISTFDFIQFGAILANSKSDNIDFDLGVAVGTTKMTAVMVRDAYRDYSEFWKARQAAALSGRELTAEESVRRQRRGDMTRRVIQGYRADIDGTTG
jgi:hypothetical protein